MGIELIAYCINTVTRTASGPMNKKIYLYNNNQLPGN
jgi:hypothetical protein